MSRLTPTEAYALLHDPERWFDEPVCHLNDVVIRCQAEPWLYLTNGASCRAYEALVQFLEA